VNRARDKAQPEEYGTRSIALDQRRFELPR
jgi:hypothetical protein